MKIITVACRLFHEILDIIHSLLEVREAITKPSEQSSYPLQDYFTIRQYVFFFFFGIEVEHIVALMQVGVTHNT